MKVDGVFWFTTRRGVVGIVRGTDEMTGEKKAYIGTATGDNERADLAQIVLRGVKFPVEAAYELKTA